MGTLHLGTPHRLIALGLGLAALGLPAGALAQPAKVTEELIQALRSEMDCCTDPREREILEVALGEVVPAIQAEPDGLEAHIVGNVADAIRQGQPEAVVAQCASQGGGCCPEEAGQVHLAAVDRLERERPGLDDRGHDHSSHDHGHTDSEHEHQEHEREA